MNAPQQSFETQFTHREREILYCIVAGLSSKEIAQKLFISENTVANHRKNMLRKKGAKSSVELVCGNLNFYLR